MGYILSFDQSTQGTKAMILDAEGRIICRRDLPHRQIVNSDGWVSHDPEEIYSNVLGVAKKVIEDSGIDAAEIAAIGISNQRETSVAWNRETGKPACHAIVWQCARAKELCERVVESGVSEEILDKTGMPVSSYFPASKMAWILENEPLAAEWAREGMLCFGTIDSWLVFNMTGGAEHRTDYSNASRTQLFNIHTLSWDEDICRAFGIDIRCLPKVTDSDGFYGETDLGGILPKKVQICGVLGDSHGALFGQGCIERGMTKATYGTGSSIMMNIGETAVKSKNGLVTSLAWKWNGKVNYVMEGNINYTGAAISWLQKDVKLIESAGETEALCREANADDTTYLVPAFSGLGAPYWNSNAKAAFIGMSRTTGRAELVKATVECIAYQIADVVRAMEADSEIKVPVLRVDGGPTKNGYLMQFQSDILGSSVQVPDAEELSGLGAGYMAGIHCGLYNESVLSRLNSVRYNAQMFADRKDSLIAGWLDAVKSVIR
ncbi:MAG: glycerol kinase [Eubacteriales bacterium]|nr:glycerol kinase [Eubacteriales bacterium]